MARRATSKQKRSIPMVSGLSNEPDETSTCQIIVHASIADFGTCLAERVAQISLARMFHTRVFAAEKARGGKIGLAAVGGQRRRRGRRRSRIPTSILLIKVITLRTESANLILIDVKLRRYGGGGAVRRVRREGGGTRGCWGGWVWGEAVSCRGWIRLKEEVGYNQLPPHWIMGRDPRRPIEVRPLKCTSDTSGKTGFLSFLISAHTPEFR